MSRPRTYQTRVQVPIEHFAHAVCSELGGDDAQPEIERGFANFTKVIARILANDLNRQQSEFDNRIE